MKIGILGAGQLGRMLALAGYPLGLHFRLLDPSANAPAGQLAETINAEFTDDGALEEFREGLDVVTYEFENVPTTAVGSIGQHLPVYPPVGALETAQDRLNEKSLFERLGIPVPLFAPVENEASLLQALEKFGLPAVLKTRRGGYDGKGQFVLREEKDVQKALSEMGEVPLLVEQLVPFERELSIIAIRSKNGETAFYPLVENRHHKGILRVSLAPAADVSSKLQADAESYAFKIMQELDYVGVLAIEFFVHQDQLLVNEMAPRVHNSGHWTIEGAETSQFENHLRAILGLPLGPTKMLGHSAMFNLISSVPSTEELLSIPGMHVHLYDKAPVENRKLGHMTLRTLEGRGVLEALVDDVLARDWVEL